MRSVDDRLHKIASFARRAGTENRTPKPVSRGANPVAVGPSLFSGDVLAIPVEPTTIYETEHSVNLSDVLSKAKKRRARKRRGRGQGSGLGKTCGRGYNGAASRSGWSRRYGYDGGGTSLIRRLPKRGFSNFLFRRKYDLVNLETLEARFESGDRVNLEVLAKRRILSPVHGRLKVLARGDIKKKLTVVAHAASETARQKIEAAGGKLEGLEPPRKKKRPPVGKSAAEKSAPEKGTAKTGGAKKSAEKKSAEKKSQAGDKGKPVKGEKNP